MNIFVCVYSKWESANRINNNNIWNIKNDDSATTNARVLRMLFIFSNDLFNDGNYLMLAHKSVIRQLGNVDGEKCCNEVTDA